MLVELEVEAKYSLKWQTDVHCGNLTIILIFKRSALLDIVFRESLATLPCENYFFRLQSCWIDKLLATKGDVLIE